MIGRMIFGSSCNGNYLTPAVSLCSRGSSGRLGWIRANIGKTRVFTCPANVMNTMTILTLYCQKELNLPIQAMQFPGAMIGCSNNPNKLPIISRTLGTEQRNSLRRPKSSEKQ